MKKNGVLDIAVRLDFKDMLSELAGQVDAIASTAGKGLSKAASNEISEIKNVIKDLQSEMDKVSYGKVSTKTFEAANKTIISQIENLQKRTTALEVGMKGLVDTMSQAEGGKFAGELSSLSTAMDNLRENTTDALDVLKQFQDIAKKSGGAVNFVNTDNLKDLEEEKNTLEAIMGLIQGKRRSAISVPVGDYEKLEEVIKKTASAYEKFNKLQNAKEKDPKALLTAQRNLAVYYSSLREVLTNPDFKLIGEIAQSFDKEFMRVDKVLKKHEDSIRERIDNINNVLSSSTSAKVAKNGSETQDGVKYDKDKDKVTVPMKISTSPTSVLKEAEKIIDAVNSNLKNKPLEVEFKLISGYSSKKTNQALKQFQGEIDALEDGLVKDEFQDIYNKIAKDFNKEIALKVDTKHIKDAAEETKKLMSQIQKTLNEKLAIHPRVEFTPEETAMIQSSLDKVADNITLTISNITLSDEVKTKLENAVDKKQAEVEKELAKAATKKEKSKKKDTLDTTEAAKLKEITQSIELATGSLAVKLDEINSGSLQPIILSLNQIGQMINILGQQAGSLPEVFDDITGSLETMLTALQQGLGVKTGGELDAQFNALKNRVGSIKGDLKDPPKAKTRNPRVEELKEIIRLYKEYQSLGGAKSIDNLGGADNVQKWLKKHVNDEIAPKETTEISKVEEAVDNVSKKVDAKNEKFKEEASVVKAAASDEVKSLQNVVDVLQKMFENLAQINQRGFASWKVADWKQAISDALTEIDKVQLKASENEGLGSIKVQVEPLIDPMEFANRVTSALSGVSAEINIVPSFNPNEIGNEIGKMLNSKVGESAQEASEAKQKFSEANAEVLSSIAQSIGGLGSEAEAFEKISKALKTLTKLPSEKISELALSLLDVREALDTPLGNSTFIDSIKSIVDSGVDFEALSKVLSASQKQIQKAQEIIKGDKTKIVSHNGIKAFLDPTNTVDAKKMAIIEKTARKYADDLGDIVSIQRNVEADRLSYNVKGSNGNSVILGKDSEGGWIVSRQYLKESNSIDKIEEKRYQSEQKAKERERKLIEDQAKAINKAQEKAYNERIKAEEKQQNEYAKLFDEAEKRQNTQIEQMAQGREKAIERANKEKYLSELKQAEAANKAQDKAYADEQKQLRDREALYSKLFDEAEAKQRKFVEDMASGRERISDRSQRDEKAGEIEQAKAINKAQEEAYKKRLQTEEMYAKLFDEAELKRREKEKKQTEAAIKEQEKLDREYGKLFDQAEARQKKLPEDMGHGRERANERLLKEQRDLERKQAEASNKNLDREYNERLKRIKELDSYEQKSREKLSSAKTVSKELSPDFVSEIEKAKSELDELYQLIDSHRNGKIFSQEDANRIEEIKKDVDAVQDALKVKANSSSIDKLLQKIGTDLKDNSKMAPELRNRFLLLRESIDGLRKSGEGLDDISLKKFSAEFQHLHEEMIRTGQTGKGFFQSIAEAAKSQTTQFIARYFSLQDWIRYAQQAFEQVKSIDSALTELRKVSDASTSRLAQNFEASSKAAQDLGHSISGVINITADWARLNITGLIYSNV